MMMSNKWEEFDKDNPKLPPGKYEYKISKPGYETIVDTFQVTDKEIEINKILKANGYNLTINTTPKDAVAKLEINGHFIEGKEFSLSPGIYNYEVSRETYSTSTGSVEIIDRNRSLNVSLTGTKYRLAILCNYSEAIIEVQIDGIYITGNVHRLVPGDYRYRVTMDGFSEVTGTAKIFDKDVVIPVTFDEDKFRVTFDVTPKSALTELQIGRDWFEGTEYDLLPGKYTYVVSHPAYKDKVGILYVKDQDILNYEVNLEPLFNMEPAGKLALGRRFTLYIEDGKIHGMGIDDYGQISNIPSGNNFIQVSAGSTHGVALNSDGKIFTWGGNNNKQCDMDKNLKYKQIYANSDLTLGIDSNNFVRGAGGHGYANSDKLEYIKIPSGLKAKYLDSELGGCVVIDMEGNVHSYDTDGSNRNRLDRIPEFKCVALSYSLINEYRLYINEELELVNGEGDIIARDIYKSLSPYEGALTLNVDGKVLAYMTERDSIIKNIPANVTESKCVHMDMYYNANAGVITDNGEIIIWGDNSEGQCDVPDGKNRLVFDITPKDAIVEVTTPTGVLVANRDNNHTVRVEHGSYSYIAKLDGFEPVSSSVISDKYTVSVKVSLKLNLDIRKKNKIYLYFDYSTISYHTSIEMGLSYMENNKISIRSNRSSTPTVSASNIMSIEYCGKDGYGWGGINSNKEYVRANGNVVESNVVQVIDDSKYLYADGTSTISKTTLYSYISPNYGIDINGRIQCHTTDGIYSKMPQDTGYIIVESDTSKYSDTGYAAAIKENGKMYIWSKNGLIDCSTYTGSSYPKGSNFIKVECTRTGGVALDSNGYLHAWGSLLNGVLYDKNYKFVDIKAKESVAVAIDINNKIYAWGEDGGSVVGTLSDLDTINGYYPVVIATNAIGSSSSYDFSQQYAQIYYTPSGDMIKGLPRSGFVSAILKPGIYSFKAHHKYSATRTYQVYCDVETMNRKMVINIDVPWHDYLTEKIKFELTNKTIISVQRVQTGEMYYPANNTFLSVKRGDYKLEYRLNGVRDIQYIRLYLVDGYSHVLVTDTKVTEIKY